MNWEAIGAIGEVGGAIAVVITLLLLLRQIRENTRETAAATAASYMQAYSAWNQCMSDPELAHPPRDFVHGKPGLLTGFWLVAAPTTTGRSRETVKHGNFDPKRSGIAKLVAT